jgi:hypothetical protein
MTRPNRMLVSATKNRDDEPMNMNTATEVER